MKKKWTFLYRNGLSISLLGFMLIFWAGQFYTGWITHNDERAQAQLPELGLAEYSCSGHFIQATFENWESEFLQMAIYVLFTVFLRQKGSVESRKLDGEEGAEEEAKEDIITVCPDSPWPVKKGGIWLAVYKNSLSVILALLFLVSFVMHFVGSYKNDNDERAIKGLPPGSAADYIMEAKFWFESFQNWQSEFLAVAAIVLLTIWFRQQNSPESKPVSTASSKTGR